MANGSSISSYDTRSAEPYRRGSIDRVGLLPQTDAPGLLEALEDETLGRKLRLRDAELELLHQQALCDVLAEEETRLRRRAARLEAALAELDAQMHLALAREREDLARAAIERGIPRRRSLAALHADIACLARERVRLAAGLPRRRAICAELRSVVSGRGAQICAPRSAASAGRAVPPLRRAG